MLESTSLVNFSSQGKCHSTDCQTSQIYKIGTVACHITCKPPKGVSHKALINIPSMVGGKVNYIAYVKIPQNLSKVPAKQLSAHLSNSNVFEPFQSAFRSSHSSETALTKAVNDLLLHMHSYSMSVLLLLYLS